MSVFREAIYGVRFDDESKEDVIERREEIVRCRGCLFFDARGNIGQWCTLLEFGKKNIANGFCAWGERREAE